MKKPAAKPSSLADAGPHRMAGVRVGRLLGPASGDAVPVEFEGSGGPVKARLATDLGPGLLAEAVAERRGAVLLFEDGDPRRPIVVALLASSTPLIDAILAKRLPQAPREARLDGVRVELEGREEVVLRCGRASLTLRRDGQVVIRGVNIRTEASQVQKIRGGKVQIN